MATIYADYGSLNGNSTSNIINGVKHNQVYQVTHNGEVLLPARQRSFISFSFGGKKIEDFDLIACSDGDGISRNGYSEFQDLTTDYDIMDGQYYHGTHFSPFTLSLRLVSDDLDQRQLDRFLHWFRGGITRELVLAAHPNRAIMARISAPPQLDNLIPFEKKIQVQVGGQSLNTSTTTYRGFINLDFVSDSSFWYGKSNLFTRDKVTGFITLPSGFEIGGEPSDSLTEALKIAYEDTVPIQDLVSSTMHFGGTLFAQVQSSVAYSLIARKISSSDWKDNTLGYFTINNNGVTEYWKGARIEENKSGVAAQGRIAGASLEQDTGTNQYTIEGELNAGSNNKYYFFYGGNAPSPTILKFTVPIQINLGNNKVYTINTIANSISNIESGNSNAKDYSTITIMSQHTKEFDFTTPNIITSWNKVLSLINAVGEMSNDNKPNWKDFVDKLRDYIRHPAVRAFAISIMNFLQKNNKSDGNDTSNNLNNLDLTSKENKYFKENGQFTSTGIHAFRKLLRRFFNGHTQNDGKDGWDNAPNSSMRFTFDAEKGIATGEFQYWQSDNSTTNIIDKIVANEGATSANKATYFKTHTENVGDMLRSNWLYIEDQNEFDSEGKVSRWKGTNEATKAYSHCLFHNLPVPISHIKLEYKYMYL